MEKEIKRLEKAIHDSSFVGAAVSSAVVNGRNIEGDRSCNLTDIAKNIAIHSVTHFRGGLYDKAMAVVKAILEYEDELIKE